MLVAHIKIMPSSVEASLEEIKGKVKEIVEKEKGKFLDSKEEPIAFGLKALIVLVSWPEEKGSDELEDQITAIETVSSIQVLNMSR